MAESVTSLCGADNIFKTIAACLVRRSGGGSAVPARFGLKRTRPAVRLISH